MLLIARDPFAHLPQASEFRDSYLSRNSPNVEPPRADVFSGPTTSSDRRAADERDELAPPHEPPSKLEDDSLPHRREAVVRHSKSDSASGFGNQVLISSHRKLLRSKAVVVSVAETPGRDSGRHGRERRAQANRRRSVESGLGDAKTGG